MSGKITDQSLIDLQQRVGEIVQAEKDLRDKEILPVLNSCNPSIWGQVERLGGWLLRREYTDDKIINYDIRSDAGDDYARIETKITFDTLRRRVRRLQYTTEEQASKYDAGKPFTLVERAYTYPDGEKVDYRHVFKSPKAAELITALALKKMTELLPCDNS